MILNNAKKTVGATAMACVVAAGCLGTAGVYCAPEASASEVAPAAADENEVMDLDDQSLVRILAELPSNDKGLVCVIGETSDKPEIDVRVPTHYEEATPIEEGVGYVRDGWYKYTSGGFDNGPIKGTAIQGAPSEEGYYYYQVKGIGDFSGTAHTPLYYAVGPNDLSLFNASSWKLLYSVSEAKGVSPLLERPSATKGKVSLVKGTDYELGNWVNLMLRGDSWKPSGKGTAAAPTKPGIYGLWIKGTGNFAGQSKMLRVALYTPTMTYNIATLGYDYASCEGIKSFTTGPNVKRLETEALDDCKNLSKMVIGKNVTKIGSYAFSGCKKLKTITVRSAKLTADGVYDSLYGSSVSVIKVSTGNKTTDAKLVKKYKKIFTKSNCGKKVVIK